MSDDQDSKDDVVPRLTIGQRILTALPRIGGSAAGTPRSEPEAETEANPRPTPRRSPQRRAPETVVEDADTGDLAITDDTTGVDASESLPSGEPVPDDGVGAGRATERRPPGSPAQPPKTISASGKATSAKATSGMSKDELVVAIKRINDQERKLGLLIAPVGAVLGVLYTAYEIHINPAVGHKDHVSQSVLVLYGVARVAFSVLVALAALWRRRSFLGFALLFLGTSFGSPIVALPFWFVGGWLIWRAFKWQKELAAITGSERRAASAGRSATTRSDPRTRSRGAAERRPKKNQKTPNGPEASKRYTPPKPTRPKPPASAQ